MTKADDLRRQREAFSAARTRTVDAATKDYEAQASNARHLSGRGRPPGSKPRANRIFQVSVTGAEAEAVLERVGLGESVSGWIRKLIRKELGI